MSSPNSKESPDDVDAVQTVIHFPNISKKELIDLVEKYKSRTFEEDLEFMKGLGGTEEIRKKLEIDEAVGVRDEQDKKRRDEQFGSNFRPNMVAKACFEFFKEQISDTMLIILICAATLSLVLNFATADVEDYGTAWIDGTAILIAVAIVSGVGSIVDYRKEVEFVKQTNEENDRSESRILRNGKLVNLHPNFVCVGDILSLEVGIEIPVDGIVLEHNQLATDESAMTGESEERRKETYEDCIKRKDDKNHLSSKQTYSPQAQDHHLLPSPVVMSGTNVSGGEGKMMALVVGDCSALGEILKKSQKKPQTTPLQEKLEKIAGDIGIVGTIFALLTVHGLMLLYFIDGLRYRNVDLFGGEEEGDKLLVTNLNIWVQYFIIGVAIIVVAVPEGLPLAVMISLAYSMKKMLQDNNLVKRLASCEIMGGADNICSDKTGTLTLNKMTVTRVFVGKDVNININQEEKTDEDGNRALLPLQLSEYFNEIFSTHIAAGIICNSPEKTGATDRSMVEFIARDKSIDPVKIREQHEVNAAGYIRFPFSSKRKRMSTVISNATGQGGYDKRLCIKGASEIVKGCCSHYLDENGERQALTDAKNEEMDGIIKNYAEGALRTIVMAYKDLNEGDGGEKHNAPEDSEVKDVETDGLTLICIIGIMDIVRQEVPQAVADCIKAGVTVRMVTGDNLITAKAIAVNCGIITAKEKEDPHICVEGPEFYSKMGGLLNENTDNEKVKNMKEFKKYANKLKVMARSRPEDKYLLVTGLRNLGATVAVTGDGTNDAPALRKADVGFGMSLAGTDTCKKAADILLTDDNFASLVKAVSWGRNVYDNIQRFLQFQLTVNVNALFTVLISSLTTGETPLHAIQLLWVNLIMDSLAALALATELPKPELLERPPQNRDDHIVSKKMLKHIVGMATFMTLTLFMFIFAGEYMIYEPEAEYKYTRQDSCCVFPGRKEDWDGNPLYSVIEEEYDENSRHMTWVFHFFVFMQIWNMICARKIHDEKNIFEGVFSNLPFIGVWLFIVIGQVAISFTGKFFHLHSAGLSWQQHLLAMGFAMSVFLVNLILKFLPDSVVPFALGPDSVHDREYNKKAVEEEDHHADDDEAKSKTGIN